MTARHPQRRTCHSFHFWIFYTSIAILAAESFLVIAGTFVTGVPKVEMINISTKLVKPGTCHKAPTYPGACNRGNPWETRKLHSSSIMQVSPVLYCILTPLYAIGSYTRQTWPPVYPSAHILVKVAKVVLMLWYLIIHTNTIHVTLQSMNSMIRLWCPPK